MREHHLTASFVTLSGAGFGQPARYSFQDRIRAAKAAGFQGIGQHLDELSVLPDSERDRYDTLLGESALVASELEFLSGWTTGVAAPSTPVAASVAERWGGHHVTAGEFTNAPLDISVAAEGLAQTAAALEPFGVKVAVEAFAWSSINTIEKALEIIEASNAPNVGLMIDVWHFYNTGGTLTSLGHLPQGCIAAVQLNNGPRVHGDFLINARTKRWLPDEGDLDVIGLIEAVTANGYDGPWFVEVSNPAYRELPLLEAARRAHDSSRTVLHQALGLPCRS